MDFRVCNFFLLSVALWYISPIDVYLRLMGPNGTELISHVIPVGEPDESESRDDVREAFVSWSFSGFFSFAYLYTNWLHLEGVALFVVFYKIH